MSGDITKPPDNIIAPTVKYIGHIMYVKLNGNCLKQDKITFNYGKMVNTYIAYDFKSNFNNFSPYLENCLIFGANMSSSVHVNNKTKIDLILGEGITHIVGTTFTAEKMYSIDFATTKKKIMFE